MSVSSTGCPGHLVVTGGARGFGRALVLAAHVGGWRVSVCVRRAVDASSFVGLERLSVGVLDVRDAAAVTSWLATSVRLHGQVDVAVSSAAILGPKAAVSVYPLDMVRSVLDTNVAGAFTFTQAVLPHLRAPGGRIIHMSSYVGRYALPGYGAYALSKFAIEGLARLVAAEHDPAGVISIALDPGMIDTDMLAAAIDGPTPPGAHTASEAAEALLDLAVRLGPEHQGRTVELFPS